MWWVNGGGFIFTKQFYYNHDAAPTIPCLPLTKLASKSGGEQNHLEESRRILMGA